MDQDKKRVVEIVEILLEESFSRVIKNEKQNLKAMIPSEESVDLSRELREILLSKKVVLSFKNLINVPATKRMAIKIFLVGFVSGTWSKTTPREERKIRREHK
jgi:hypothetical protein